MKLNHLFFGREIKSHDEPRQHIKKHRHHFANKGLSSQSYGFSSSHVRMWKLDHKEGWVLKDWCFWIVELEKTDSPLDSKDIKPVNPQENQLWIFFGRIDAEAETPILWPCDEKRKLTGKILMLGKIEGRRRRGWQDEMVGWHHWLNGHEFDQTPGDSEGQESLVRCSPWGHKDSDMTATEQQWRVEKI